MNTVNLFKCNAFNIGSVKIGDNVTGSIIENGKYTNASGIVTDIIIGYAKGNKYYSFKLDTGKTVNHSYTR